MFSRRCKYIVFGSLISLCSIGGIALLVQHLTQTTPAVITTYQPTIDSDTAWIKSFFKRNMWWLASEPMNDFSLDYRFSHKVSSEYPEQAQPMSTFMLKHHKQPIGFISYYKENTTVGKILFVGIDESWRGHGYVVPLLNQATKDLCVQGCRFVDLVTRTQNLAAQASYKKYGFYETGRNNEFVYFRFNCKS